MLLVGQKQGSGTSSTLFFGVVRAFVRAADPERAGQEARPASFRDVDVTVGGLWQGRVRGKPCGEKRRYARRSWRGHGRPRPGLAGPRPCRRSRRCAWSTTVGACGRGSPGQGICSDLIRVVACGRLKVGDKLGGGKFPAGDHGRAFRGWHSGYSAASGAGFRRKVHLRRSN